MDLANVISAVMGSVRVILHKVQYYHTNIYAIYGQDYFTYQNTVLAQSVRKCAGDNRVAVLANLTVRQQAT
jgi:hypothetical protein